MGHTHSRLNELGHDLCFLTLGKCQLLFKMLAEFRNSAFGVRVIKVLPGGGSQPSVGLNRILPHALAFIVHQAQSALSWSQSALRGTAYQTRSLFMVLWHTVTRQAQHSEIEGGFVL